ncbi:MAG TPA: hypothetical protein VM260_15490 [Pirellula sp.]|nr:hypothetical protein [Pirellula sp.]
MNSQSSIKAQRLILQQFNGVARYFAGYLKGRACTHKYQHTFVCGAVAVVEYTQFRRAALVKHRWLRHCCCQCEREADECDRELEKWMESVEETEQRHFKFRREASLTLDLSATETLIFQPDQTGGA